MPHTVLPSLLALFALVPATVLALRGEARNTRYWAALALAVLGPSAWALLQVDDAWRTGLAVTLWVTIAVTMLLFAGLTMVTEAAWRLTTLLLPYLLVLGTLATIWERLPEPMLSSGSHGAWIVVHILVSVVTYGLVNLAAVAGLAVFLQERALKRKRPSWLVRLLPAVADAEALQVRLLVASQIVLGVGLATGISVYYLATGRLIPFDHKTVLSLATFVLIAVLLVAHYRVGLRGRRAARLVLLAWLLLTLAYPGVKFVTGVLMA
ncbi:MAG: cytochrome c biogenesis protein CcsA [Proteobacteria bacterium]|nr:cytochrome c biogenesis protein CcsA [Pseudomonadota bacterium]MBI3496061.1 cytochrome c biogenesis protein CcsA [Pseudomonadota bacterium]